ncbi:MAG: glucose-1-phosphate adenylyltransferase [Bacteroidota bacterium]
MILGGGVGSRLYPLTSERSKPAVPIGGKYRLIDIPISNCLNSGVRRMFVLTQFNSASLNQHIKNTYNFDMFSRGFVDILAAEQSRDGNDWYQGTADAVRQCMRHLYNHDYDYILILSGDQLYQMDFEALAKYHIAQKADLTVATIPVNAADASGFGIMKVAADGMIDSFTEKPSQDILPNWSSPVPPELKEQGKEYLASMGIYIFSKAAIKKLFEDSSEAVDFGKQIIPEAINGGYRVASYAYDGYWEDIGTIKAFFDCNIALTDDIPAFNLFDNKSIIYTRPRLLGPSKFIGTRVNNAVVAEACIISADLIERSLIGLRSRIGEGTVVKETITFGNDYFETLDEVTNPDQIPMGIGENCHIERCIVDKDCRIGDNVTIRGHESLENEETDTHIIVDGIVVMKKGAIVPNGTVIGKAKA